VIIVLSVRFKNTKKNKNKICPSFNIIVENSSFINS